MKKFYNAEIRNRDSLHWFRIMTHLYFNLKKNDGYLHHLGIQFLTLCKKTKQADSEGIFRKP